ncbi:MAG TPA: TIGR02710 family CRISPR-associated CARF protein [Anaerolineae bacterium]|nr:TIGR02710 family CRISPR-associated CARF protein [Anaerolineae bacterium]
MGTLLVLTVGSSCAPVITAIRDYQPDFVCFVVSGGDKGSRKTVDGPGNPCGDPRKVKCECGKDVPLGDPKGANILVQTGLPDNRYEILELPEPDDLSSCYAQIRATLTQLRAERSGWRFLADYTGGTKTMTAALTLAALENGYELSLVKGTRADLVKVRNGTEMAALVNVGEVRARQQMAEAQRLFNRYAYASAADILQSILRAAPLPPELQREIGERVTLCRAFDAWDRFDHAQARALLETQHASYESLWRFLKLLSSARPGYAPVLDLWRNAERRAARGRYDDAVARLYRALEMLAQLRLEQRDPALKSGDLDVTLLPEPLRLKYEALREPGEKGKIKLGLRQDYELLVELADPLGSIYQECAKRLLQALLHRNESILAHGQKPIAQTQWNEMWEIVTALIQNGLSALKIQLEAPQFPQWGD